MTIKRFFLPATLIAAVAVAMPANASGWDDDDDIYYNPSSKPAKTETPQQQTTQQRTVSNYVPNTVVDYPAADTYVPATGAGLNVDIDAYNRNGQFLVADSVPADSAAIGADTYNYTRRIERFYDGDVVNASGDQELIDSYYSTQPVTDINVYVVNGWGGYWPYNSWAWSSPDRKSVV